MHKKRLKKMYCDIVYSKLGEKKSPKNERNGDLLIIIEQNFKETLVKFTVFDKQDCAIVTQLYKEKLSPCVDREI
jgi:hypothetical protein